MINILIGDQFGPLKIKIRILWIQYFTLLFVMSCIVLNNDRLSLIYILSDNVSYPNAPWGMSWIGEMNVYMYACMYICMYVCMYACMYACMYVCMYASMYACMYVCIYVRMHARMYVWKQFENELYRYVLKSSFYTVKEFL